MSSYHWSDVALFSCIALYLVGMLINWFLIGLGIYCFAKKYVAHKGSEITWFKLIKECFFVTPFKQDDMVSKILSSAVATPMLLVSTFIWVKDHRR